MRKLLFITLIILAIFGLSFTGYKVLNLGKSPATIESGTAEVALGNVESAVTAQGTLEPKDYVDVGAQVSGLVETLHVEIGDVVKKGDLIAEIDPDVYESQVKGDEARLETLQAQKSEQKALITQAQQKLKRNQNLMQDKAISAEVLEDAQTDHDVALAKLKSLEAQIKEATSTLEGNEANLSYTKIYAPMDGTVVSQSVKEGQTINANQTAPVIVQIANLDVMTVRAEVAEADITKLTPGMSMYFTILGSKNRRWEGKIRQILPSPETVNDVVLYNVLVDVENKDHQLMTGMTTQMFFVLGKAENVSVIPVSALLKRMPEADTEQGQAYQVKVAGKNPELKTVIISLSDRSKAAVAEGLEVGQKVFLNVPQPKSSSSSMPPPMGRL